MVNIPQDARWGVTWYSALGSTVSDVYFPDFEALKAKIKKPATTYVTHDGFVGLGRKNATQAEKYKYKEIKGKNGLIMSGLSPIVDGSFTCAGGAPEMEKFCLLSFDYDDGVPSDFTAIYKEVLKDYTYIAYTTVSSTAEMRRWRIVVPLAHFVDAETKTALMRIFAERIGWAGFDDAGLRPKQRMALPVKLADQEVLYEENDGRFLDETALPDGWDIASLPLSPREREKAHKRKTHAKQALTPMEYVKKDRGGVIGAFLKAYDCESILLRSGLYKKHSGNEKEQRWSRTTDNMGGLVVYPSDTAYCFYSSDKLGGRGLLNSFQLAVALLYNDDYKEAIQAAKKDAKVRHELMQGLIDKKPADSGDWGDGEAYSGGWRGILERLVEYKKYKYAVTNDRKSTGFWLVYDGKRYRTVGADEIADDIEMVLRISCAMNPDLADIYSDYITTNTKCLNLVKSLSGMPGMKIPRKELDTNLRFFNCDDKIIDIDKYIEAKTNGTDVTECLLEHSPEYYITQIAPIKAVEAVTPNADAVEFLDRFLEEVQPDQEARWYMLTAIGSSLLDCSRDNKIIILQGEGRNGKSSFIDCLEGALGDEYYGVANAENFRMGAKDPSRPNPELDRLRNVRIATFSESNPHIYLDTAYLKQFWGSDVRTRDLQESGGKWRPRFRGIFDLNSMPRLDPSDQAFRARLRIIPWEVSFYGRENPAVQKRMQDDKSVQAALIHHMLEGCYLWAKNGYMLDRGTDIPPAVKTMIDDFYNEIDDILGYIDGYVNITNGPNDFVSVDDLLADYSKSGGSELKKNTFSKQFKKRMMALATTNANIKEGRAYMMDGTRPRGWFGIRLRRLTDDELVQQANEQGGHYARWEANLLRNKIDKKRMEKIIQPVAVGQDITQEQIDAMAEKDEIPF